MKLLNQIKELQNSDVKNQIDTRLKELESNDIFNELCFCILTANSTAERCIHVQSKVGDGFSTLTPVKLQKELKKHGTRFHTKRAGYIVEARKQKKEIHNSLKLDEKDSREWLAQNIKGLGYKESSHFLRNIGFKDSAIIDFHIIDVLAEHKLIDKPKLLNRTKYLEIEQTLRKISKKLKMNLAELDFYLWYMATGKVLK